MIKDLSDKDKKAFALIRNKIIHEGVTPTLREINAFTGGKSPRSASIVLDRLIAAGLIKRVGRKIKLLSPSVLSELSSVTTIDVPLVGTVPCGTPLLAEENIETYLPITTALARKGNKYFLLRATGDSMNKEGIISGNILLVRQQSTAENGEKVVALVNDEATVKIFEKTPHAVILRPRSTNPIHKPIVLTDNCVIQGIVVAILPSNLF